MQYPHSLVRRGGQGSSPDYGRGGSPGGSSPDYGRGGSPGGSSPTDRSVSVTPLPRPYLPGENTMATTYDSYKPSKPDNPLAKANIKASELMAKGHDAAQVDTDKRMGAATAEMYKWRDRTARTLNPYMSRGNTAAGQLAGGQYDLAQYQNQYGTEGPQYDPNAAPKWGGFRREDLEEDPGYRYRLEEAQKSIQRSAAARSGAMSGRTLMALQRKSQDMASQEWSNARNRAVQDYQIANQRNVQDHQLMSQDFQNKYARQAQDYALGAEKTKHDMAIRQGLADQGFRATGIAGQFDAQYANTAHSARMTAAQQSMQNIIGKYNNLGQGGIAAESAIENRWINEQNIKNKIAAQHTNAAAVAAQKRANDWTAGLGLASLAAGIFNWI